MAHNELELQEKEALRAHRGCAHSGRVERLLALPAREGRAGSGPGSGRGAAFLPTTFPQKTSSSGQAYKQVPEGSGSRAAGLRGAYTWQKRKVLGVRVFPVFARGLVPPATTRGHTPDVRSVTQSS